LLLHSTIVTDSYPVPLLGDTRLVHKSFRCYDRLWQTVIDPIRILAQDSSNRFHSNPTNYNMPQPSELRYSRVRQRTLVGSWIVSAAAATTVVLSVSLASSLQSGLPHRHARRSHAVGLQVMTDPDLLLMERIKNQKLAYDLERMYMLSPDDSEVDPSHTEAVFHPRSTVPPLVEEVPREPPKASSDRVQFKGLSTSRNTKTRRLPISGRSRSSTMPGFSVETDRQRAFRDGVRLAEQHSGKQFVDTEQARSTRRQRNGESMYKNSASVPDSMVQFADEIHQQDRISRAQEIELGEKTQEAIRLQRLYNTLTSRLDREPTDEEWCAEAGKINMEAIRQTIEEGLEAKNQLVTSNLRMVQSVVNTYIRNGLTAQYNAGDMMQEGIIALIRAAEKFEPDRGWKFSTYAMYWVRASVKRSQIYQSRVITVPQRLHENHKRLLKVEREMEADLGRKPSRIELGAEIGLSKLQVDRCFAAMEQRCQSLDQKLSNSKRPMSGDTSKDTLMEIIGSKTEGNDFDSLNRIFLREDLIETLHRHLDPAEVELLLLRYGFKEVASSKLGGQPTIAELSRTVGLKPDKVRRMINRSLKHLKSIGAEEWLAFESEL
jgi:RNA polymerase sigma factor (sigma-70 family)